MRHQVRVCMGILEFGHATWPHIQNGPPSDPLFKSLFHQAFINIRLGKYVSLCFPDQECEILWLLTEPGGPRDPISILSRYFTEEVKYP